MVEAVMFSYRSAVVVPGLLRTETVEQQVLAIIQRSLLVTSAGERKFLTLRNVFLVVPSIPCFRRYFRGGGDDEVNPPFFLALLLCFGRHLLILAIVLVLLYNTFFFV